MKGDREGLTVTRIKPWCFNDGMHLLSGVIAALVAGSPVAEAGQRSGAPPVLELPKGTGAISGTVTDATVGSPIEGVIVSLGVTSGGSIILTLPRVVIDPKGHFFFAGANPEESAR
jgi:hypothetical protein